MVLAPLILAAALLGPPPQDTFGERMGFSIDYLGMRMGTASIEVGAPDGAALPVALEAHTTGVASALYDFREKLLSRLDLETGLPVENVLDTSEKGRPHHDTTEYRRAEGKAVVIQRGKTTSTDRIAIQPETMDFVALVFQLRRAELAPGQRRTFSVLSGKDVHQVLVEVVGRETVKTKLGPYLALKIRVPTGFTGKFSEKNPTYLWLSDDPQRIVVKITTDFSFGDAAANLVSYRPGSGGAAEPASPLPP
jgi:hypothetical protein